MKLRTQITYFGGWSTTSKDAKSPRGGGGVIMFPLKLFCIAELSLHAEF